MKLGTALTIVIDVAADQRGSPSLIAALATLRALAAADAELLRRRIDALDRREIGALLPPGPGFSPRRLARALLRASEAALPAIPPIDRRATRDAAKRALRAVAIIERFAAAMTVRAPASTASAA